MKIQKYAALVKKKQYCVWVNGASGVFLGLPEALYRASFYKKDLLAPLADILKDDEGYITFRVRRTLENDKDVIVIKNGFEVVACILPVKVLSRGYIEELQDFLVMCVDQYHREQEKERIDDV